ncbi:tetratricopeptide repeat protein 12 [Lampris incognitus]|uniref:tetratricopeptide repeat protein 12 n=1 Tax=Lampris incognitus TaxID=2546036 RepID=UPI0024B576F4|nr:tetratricopeptide repeat protein 12 [Lampris incognitus]
MDKLVDFDSFLRNVDKISELVKDLKSPDTEVQQRAVEEADRFVAVREADEPCRTKINKTKINTNPPPPLPTSSENNNIDDFLKIMERDAEDRSKKRRAKEEKAKALKDKGNEAYAREEYETAAKFYSDGLAELRDVQQLYTNRAQAYIKLGKYKEAISDCEWALKCNKRCIKAYLHMGKAFLGLGNYNESRNCYEKIVKLEPGREQMVKEYQAQVDLEEERDRQERNAREEFDKGEEKATTVPQLLEKLSGPSQVPLYYYGGLELLSQAIFNCTGQTLFRLNNGFTIISGNDTVRSCLSQTSREPYSRELCLSVLKLWRVICNRNDENQKMLMICPVSSKSIVGLLASEHVSVRLECLALLRLYSQTPHSRSLVIDNVNLHMLVKNLMACILKPEQQQENIALTILENFASETKFRMKLRDLFTECIAAPFTTKLRDINRYSEHILQSLIPIIGSLAKDDVIRHNMAHCPNCWEGFLLAMKQCGEGDYKEIIYPMLGLMFNLSTITSRTIQEHAVSICNWCLGLLHDDDGKNRSRAIGVLSNILPQSPAAIQHVVQGGMVSTVQCLLKGAGPSTTKYTIKSLAVCTAVSHLARQEMVKSDKTLCTLRHLLDSSCDEAVLGNAGLCLGHCVEVEEMASNLLGSDIVLLLLRHAAGDAKNTAVQQNAAIALGKLCRAEPRHINKLRELHGLEILHSCMKLIT